MTVVMIQAPIRLVLKSVEDELQQDVQTLAEARYVHDAEPPGIARRVSQKKSPCVDQKPRRASQIVARACHESKESIYQPGCAIGSSA